MFVLLVPTPTLNQNSTECLFLQVLGRRHLELHDTSSGAVPVSCREADVHGLVSSLRPRGLGL